MSDKFRSEAIKPSVGSMKELKVYQALHLFMNAPEHETEQAFARLRLEIERKIETTYKDRPERRTSVLRATHEAFEKLSEVYRLLQFKDGDRQSGDALKQAKQCFEGKNYREALRLFESCLQTHTFDNELMLCVATAALYCEETSKVLQYSDMILRKNPQDSQAHTLKALAYLAMEQLHEAFTAIQRAKLLKPESKLIEKYYQEIRFRMSARLKGERKWKRAPLQLPLTILDGETGLTVSTRTLSVSAGGCLIECDDIPESFQFSLELNSKPILGSAMSIYKIEPKQYGIQFDGLDRSSSDALNQAVIRFLSNRHS